MVKTRRDWGDTGYADEDREMAKRWKGKKAGFVKALHPAASEVANGDKSVGNGLTEDVDSAGKLPDGEEPMTTAEATNGLDESEGQQVEQHQRPVGESEDTGDSVFVCRPLVGKMTKGGGFVGMWRKIEPSAMHRL